MTSLRRLLSVPTWLRMRLAGTQIANLYAYLNVHVYRASKGKLWAHLCVPGTEGLMPILLLETFGRRTGRRRTTPLIFCRRGDHIILAAANAGHYRHPGWFLNLRANPDVHVLVGDDRFSAVARVATSEERDSAFAEFAAAYPPLLRYASATSRKIPMVFVEPQTTGGQLQPPQ